MSMTTTITALKTSISAFTGSIISQVQALKSGKVDKVSGKGLSSNDFTSGEKSKLAGLESSKYLGVYVSADAMNSANGSPSAGDYGDVDAGSGSDVERWIWDATDQTFIIQSGAVAGETSASIKTKYEANADTNAFTNTYKSKLDNAPSNVNSSLNNKVDKVSGKGLSANDYTSGEKSKLAGISSDIDAQVINAFDELTAQFNASKVLIDAA